MKSIILGVAGSIAAYKAADLTSKLVKRGHAVFVVMTENATSFVAADDISDPLEKSGDLGGVRRA